MTKPIRPRARKRRRKGVPGVRIPLPRKPHRRHEDPRTKPPRHRKRFTDEE